RLLFEDVGGALEACRQAVADNPGASEVAELLGRAEERMAAQKALMSDSSQLGEAYLRLYPQGLYVADVRTHVAKLGGVAVEASPAPAALTLPETVAVPPEIERLTEREVIVGVQTELNRLGCEAGGAD